MIGVSSPRGPQFGNKTSLNPTTCRLQCQKGSDQTTNKIGKQSHPSEDRLLKVVLSSQSYKTHYLTWPCPSEGQDSAPLTRVQVPVPPTRKLVQSQYTNLNHQEADTRTRDTRILYPVERKSQRQKFRQNKIAKKMLQMEERDKTP